MAYISLGEAYEQEFGVKNNKKTPQIKQTMSLDEAYKQEFGENSNTGKMSLDEAFADTFKPGEIMPMPFYKQAADVDQQRNELAARTHAVNTFGAFMNAVAGGTANTFESGAAPLRMKAELSDYTAAPPISPLDSLYNTEEDKRQMQAKVAAAQKWIADKMSGAAQAVRPEKRQEPKSALGKVWYDVAESLPYTVGSMVVNAPITMLGGPAGPVLGGAASASMEARIGQAQVYKELKKKGMDPREAWEKSLPVYYKNLALLTASNTAQNVATFGAGKLLPKVSKALRVTGSTLFDEIGRA